MSFTQKAAAAAGSLAALSLASKDAEATIVHVTGSPITLNLNAAVGTEVDWDVDGEFGRDFFLRRDSFGPGSQYIYLNSNGANGRGFVNTYAYNYALPEDEIKNLPIGVVVGPTLGAGYFFGARSASFRSLLFQTSTLQFGPDAIDFTVGVPGFAGFAFDANGTTLFGWAELTIDANAPGTVTITEWAYEDTGAAIAVGDTGAAAIPEPHSLAMIAMGAAGVAAWRSRRKKQAVAKTQEA